MEWLKQQYKMGKYTTGSGKFTGKMVEPADDGSILVHQKHYIEEKINVIKIDKARKRQRYSQCTPVEINQLRTLLGGLSWVAKETRPDIAGKVAILQQTMPNPMIKDIVEANQVAEELKRKPDLGIRIQPIPMERLRVGVITDASWGNAGERYLEDSKKDYWRKQRRAGYDIMSFHVDSYFILAQLPEDQIFTLYPGEERPQRVWQQAVTNGMEKMESENTKNSNGQEELRSLNRL